MMALLLKLVGAIWNQLKAGFLHGYQQQQKSQKDRVTDSQRRVADNQRLIESAKVLLEEQERRAQEAETKASQRNDPPDVGPYEMDFYVDGKTVRVQMSRDFWIRVMDNSPAAWRKIIVFVDEELERREHEID